MLLKYSRRCSVIDDWPVRFTLYITKSQTLSGPAEHDLMGPSDLFLTDAYITRRYGRHSTPQEPQPACLSIYFSALLGTNPS